ncbi:MAG: transglutaminase-like domain-containing protein [Planctomycetota bacterium]
MSEIHPPAHCRPAAYEAFLAALQSVETNDGLLRGAFAVALHDRPEADLAAVETVIENLAYTVRRRVASESRDALLAHLHDVLFEVYGLRGNAEDYYDPANSYVPDVLSSRRGLPITLSLVYKLVADKVGFRTHGVNAPGHFLVEIEPEAAGRAPLYIDPFHGGESLDPDDVIRRVSMAIGQSPADRSQAFARASHRQWLFRLLGNLKAALSAASRERDMLAMEELQLLLRRPKRERP